MANSAADELKEFILNELIRKDSLLVKMLSTENQLKLAESFTKTLQDADVSVSNLDLKNRDTMETLKFGCRAQAAQMLDPSIKIDLKPVLKPLAKKDEEKEEEKEKNTEKNIFEILKNMLKLKLTKENKKPSKEQQEELEIKLKELARTLAKGKSGSMMMRGCVDALIRESVESVERKSLYGGIDPELGSGQERASVEGIQGGNQFARQDLSNVGDTFMAAYDKSDSGQPDPVGTRISSAVNMLANDIATASEPTLTDNASPARSPGNIPKLKPPGTIT